MTSIRGVAMRYLPVGLSALLTCVGQPARLYLAVQVQGPRGLLCATLLL